MDLDRLREKLIAAARKDSPADAVPYAFEKRITARLNAPVDYWAQWAAALWRAAAPCVAITILLGAWSLLDAAESNSSADWSQDFDQTVLAAADQEQSLDPSW